MTKIKPLGLLLLLLTFVGGSAYADTYNITTGTASFQDIGNSNQGLAGHYDQLNFGPITFSLLGPGPIWNDVAIEYVTFTVGPSCYVNDPGCENNTSQIAHLQFDVNGSLFTVDVPWHVDIASADTLTIYSMSTYFDVPGFDRLVLTTDQLVMGPNGNGTYTGYLRGDFQSVPEPGTMLLLGGSLTALPWIRRKTRL